MEAILNVRIKELEIQLQLKDAEVEQLENAIQEKALKRVCCYKDPRIVEELKRSLSCFVYCTYYIIFLVARILRATYH